MSFCLVFKIMKNENIKTIYVQKSDRAHLEIYSCRLHDIIVHHFVQY